MSETYTPSTRQRPVYKNDIPLLRRRDISLFRGRHYLSVGLIDLLLIRACRRVHVVQVVGSKIVSFTTFNKSFTENRLVV